MAIFNSLTQQQYPAAFDNAGGIYLEHSDIPRAVKYFKVGQRLGDADSMVSLAYLIDKGYAGLIDKRFLQQSPMPYKWDLRKAAELGHVGAQKAIEAEDVNSQKAAVEQQNQQAQGRDAVLTFGNILMRSIGRR